ncbi:MAG: hypothetical protein II949_12520 [Prevotella sp.]|nr:hypothetical protein [Prevotella sp.]
MKQNFSKLLAAFVLTLMAVTAQATPYKNIYVTIEVVQTGAGTVYLEAPSETHGSQSVAGVKSELKASFGEQGEGNYPCLLHATPSQGFDFLGFAVKNERGVYTEEDIFSKENPATVNVNTNRAEDGKDSAQGADDGWAQAQEKNNWSATPDFEYVALFKELDQSVNNVKVEYYQALFSAVQDQTYGTWTSELIEDGAKVKLTAVPAEGMRFVCWRDVTGNKLSTELEMIVDNVNSTYKVDFDLLPITMPATLCTFSSDKQARFDNWNEEGLKAYKVTEVGDVLTLVQVRHAGPGKGVIVEGEVGQTYEMSYQGLFLDEDNSDNLLIGTADGPVEANGNIFVLADGEQGVGFYRLASGESVPQGKAYLELDTNETRTFIGFSEDVSTEIAGLTIGSQSASVYNLAGQRVNDGFKGLVIQNGRKLIRK